MSKQAMSRRSFVKAASLATAGIALGGCAKTVVETVEVVKEVEKVVTQVVQETVVVEGEAKEVTKVVEKVATDTPVPAIVTAQGRVLPPDAAPLERQVTYGTCAESRHLDVARDIYSATAALNWGAEPPLRRNELQELVAAGCEAWTVGPEAKYVDFVVRQGAKWSDGTPITADDWVFTFQHMSDPDLDTPFAYFFFDIKGMGAHKNGQIAASEVGVEKIDDRTFRVHAERGGIPHIPALLAYQASTPAPKHLAEKDPAHWADDVQGFVSSGPYTLVKWEHNRTMEWDLNPYYNGPHKAGCVKVVNYINLGDSWNAWLDKEIDIIGLGQAELQLLRSNAKLNPLLQFFPNFQTCFLNMKATEPPLDNVKLRQAIAHAIDRETLAYQVQQGTVSVAHAMLPPGYPAWNEEELKPMQVFDVEMARQLLSAAGYPEGKDADGKQLTLDMYPNGRQPQLEFIQQQLEKNLGLAFNVFPQENTVWRKMRSEKQMQMFYGCCEYDYIDPANLLGTYWRSVDERGSGSYPWVSAEFDALLDKASTISDPVERIETYKAAERILVGEVGGVFLTHGLIFQAAWPYIAGIRPDVTGNPNFRGLDISRFQMYIRDDVDQYRKDKP